MKSCRTGQSLELGGIGIAFLLLLSTWTWGGIVQPLYVGNLAPVLNAFGRSMTGSALPQEAAGRSLVEIRIATIGVIIPPATNGMSHPYTPLLMTNSVGGIGENAKTANSGLFCLIFPQRPAAGSKIFARVYDGPTVAESAFYVDSSLAVVPATGVSLVLSFGVARPLDPGDDDGDGLNNSWEKLLGTADRPSADYDGDGMSDLHEMLAGTDPTDATSHLAFQSTGSGGVSPAGVDPTARLLRVRWSAVPGKSYQLESVSALEADSATGAAPVFEPVGGVVTAPEGTDTMDAWVDIADRDVKGIFRVRLAETGSR